MPTMPAGRCFQRQQHDGTAGSSPRRAPPRDALRCAFFEATP
ncbi:MULTISPECIES: hypothetical protein [Streptomyces]|nr:MULTISPECIES: hypothetical protein [Streptomyces]